MTATPPHPIPASSRVVVIEDDVLLAELLALALRSRLHLHDLNIFGSGRQGLQHCLNHCPDLLIVDLGLPDMNGREIIHQLRAQSPVARILVLTAEADAKLPSELLAMGVGGFVHKSSSLDEMETAVRRVLAGGLFFSTGTQPRRDPDSPSRKNLHGPAPATLTEREREIARLVATGLISKEIAAQLHLSARTVEKARAQILAKLHLRDLPGLVRWCLHHGVI